MEHWDIYDENRVKLNKTHLRREPMTRGEYHLVVEVITINDRGDILLTLRAPNKETWPNKWEYTGGSVVAGELSAEGAVRELREETGISIDESELNFVGSLKGNTALIDTYMIIKNINITELTMQENETVSAKWTTFEEFEKMMEQGEVSEPVTRRYLQLESKIKDIRDRLLKKSNN